MPTQTLTLPKLNDCHVHLREGAALTRTVPDLARYVANAIVMPNLTHPVTTVEAALAYREAILNAMPANLAFTPWMTLYLTQTTTEADITKAANHPHLIAAKLYPAGATTHAEQGVTSLDKLTHVFSAMEATGLPLLIHGEIADPTQDIFDRETQFIEQHLLAIHEQFPQLKIVLEHITTAHAVQTILQLPDTIAATITAHHLWINRTDLLAGGIKPHYYCLPVAKRESDRLALIEAAISGNPKFFLGSDSAPHPQSQKESACGCAGIYTGYALPSYYAEIFSDHRALVKFADFSHHFSAQFYQFPTTTETLILQARPLTIPAHLAYGGDVLIPFLAKQTLNWTVR